MGNKYQLWQVYYVHGGFTAFPVEEKLPEQALWRVEKPVSASSARGAVRKVNTRTKTAENPQPFVNPNKLSKLPKTITKL